MLQGSCHCKDVLIEVEELPPALISCNCSICNRLGALWARYKPEQVTISCHPDATAAYVWGDGFIEFHHCKRCGCATHHRGTEKLAEPRLGVNARMFDQHIIDRCTIRYFDGADTWKFIRE